VDHFVLLQVSLEAAEAIGPCSTEATFEEIKRVHAVLVQLQTSNLQG